LNVLPIQPLIKKTEPYLVILLLLVSSEINFPGSIEGLVRLARYATIAFLCLRISARGWPKLTYAATRDLLPWILAGISLLSVFWSANPSKTIDEFIPLIRDSCFALYIAMEYPPKEQIRLFARVLGVAGVLSLLTAIAIPSYGISYTFAGDAALTGIYKHKQYIGRLMPIGALSFLSIALETKRFRWLPWTGFLLMLSLIWLSFSKSSILLLLIALCFWPLSQLVKQKYRLKVVLSIFLLLIVGITTVLIASNLETILVDVLGKNLEFNGRLPVWTLAIEKGLERPWLGYGLSGFWTSDHAYLVIRETWLIELFREGTSIHGHNGFLDVFLQLGLIGFCCLIFSIIRVFGRTIFLINQTQQKEFLWMLQVLTIIVLSSWSESDSLIHRDFMWISYVSISFSVGLWFYRVKKKNIIKDQSRVNSITFPS